MSSEKEFKVNKYIKVKLKGKKTEIYIEETPFEDVTCSYYGDKYHTFAEMVDKIKTAEVFEKTYSTIEKYFIDLLTGLDELPEKDQYEPFSLIMDDSVKEPAFIHKNISLIENKFNYLLDKHNLLPKEFQISALIDLIFVIEKTELMERKFHDILNLFGKLSPDVDYSKVFDILIYSIHKSGLLAQTFLDILFVLKEFYNEDGYLGYNLGSVLYLIDLTKGTEIINENLTYFLNWLNKYDYKAFSSLIELNKGTYIMEERFVDLVLSLDRFTVQYDLFSKLIHANKNTELIAKHESLIEKKFIELLQGFEEFTLNKKNLENFSILIDSIKGTKVMDNCHSVIQARMSYLCVETTKIFDNPNAFGWHKYTILLYLIQIMNGTEFFNKYFDQLLYLFDNLCRNYIQKYYDKYKLDVFSKLNVAIRKTNDFEEKSAFLKKKYPELWKRAYPLSFY